MPAVGEQLSQNRQLVRHQMAQKKGAVRSDVEPTVYFETIAPQLLALIDGDDPDLRKTASYVHQMAQKKGAVRSA
jgi:hypothetical protein